MKNVILASLPLVAAMVACSSPPTDGSETVSNEQALSSWKPVLRCDGNTVVDVNVGERRNLQLVIRDRAVIDRLLSVGYMQHFVGTSYDDREIVIRGYVGSHLESDSDGHLHVKHDAKTGNGVFHPWDFHGFMGTRSDLNYYTGNVGDVNLITRNRGANALDVSFQKTVSKCVKEGQECPGDGFPCMSTCIEWFSWTEELANWRFNNCREE